VKALHLPRYPNSHPQGAPFEHYGPLQSEEAIQYAREILEFAVLKWPDAQIQMLGRAVRLWAERIAQQREDMVRISHFGLYARGDWGVGSDLDLVILIKKADEPFEARAAKCDATDLPVPADVLVHTEEEWQSLGEQRRFCRTVMQEGIWVFS